MNSQMLEVFMIKLSTKTLLTPIFIQKQIGSKDDYFVHYINWLDRIQLREEFAEAEMIQNEAHKYANNQEIKVKILEENFETSNYNNEWLELHSQERLTRQYTDYRVLELSSNIK